MSARTDIAAWPAPTVRVERDRVIVRIDVPDGCHIQSHTPREPFLIPTVIEFDDVDGVELGTPIYPEAEVERFEWTPIELDIYRGTVEVVVPFTAAPVVARGGFARGSVRYQGCTETLCLPPVSHPIAFQR